MDLSAPPRLDLPRLHLYRLQQLRHTVELVVPDRSYASVGPPRLFGFVSRDAGVLSWFPAELLRTTITCPDEYVVRLPVAHVVHGHHLIVPPDHALADTFDFDDRAVNRPEFNEIGALIRQGEVLHHPSDGRPLFHIFKDVYYNYGHMLVEVLPKLLHIRAMGIRDFVLLYPWSGLDFLAMVQHTAAVLGLTFEPVVCYNNQIVRAENVRWIGPVAQHDRRKSQTLRDLAQALTAAAKPAFPSRLFVTRPPSANRSLANLAQLEDLARAHGYTVIEPSTLSFADQISAFHGADHVLGLMGAALTNTVFMRPGARVSMLTTRRIDPFFYDIARLIGLHFDWAFTEPAETWTNIMQTEPWTIDAARFEGLLPWLD